MGKSRPKAQEKHDPSRSPTQPAAFLHLILAQISVWHPSNTNKSAWMGTELRPTVLPYCLSQWKTATVFDLFRHHQHSFTFKHSECIQCLMWLSRNKGLYSCCRKSFTDTHHCQLFSCETINTHLVETILILTLWNNYKLSFSGSNNSALITVSQRLKGFLPSSMELKMPDDLLETLYKLIDLVSVSSIICIYFILLSPNNLKNH